MSVAISIVLSVYNGESHLREALDSALGQTLQDIELLCIDDGSTDASGEILARYAEADSRVRVICQENMGVGRSRNTGIQEAVGEYLAFLDVDDYYPDSDCLQTLYDLAKKTGTHVAGGSLLFLRDGECIPAQIGSTNFSFASEGVIRYTDFQQAYYCQRFIFSRELFSDPQLRFPDYRRFQDVVFMTKTMLAAKELAVTPRPTYVYRPSSNYANLSETQINDMLLGYIDVLTIARDNNLYELANFLGKRIGKHAPVRNMVLASIQAGNKVAKERYETVCSLLESMHASNSLDKTSWIKKLKQKIGGLFSGQ